MLFLVLDATRQENDRKLLTLAVGAAALLYCGYGIYEFLGPRPSYYEAGLGLWKENLWLGVGPGNFEEAVEEYYPRKGLGEPDTFIRVHAHNLFLDLAIQYGTLGPVAFLFFIAAVFRSLCHHWSKSAYALAGIGLLIAFLVHNLFDVSFPSTALEMGFLLGLAVRESSRDQ